MSEDGQKIEYVNALEESRKLEDLLAALNLKLKNIGSNLTGLGKALEGSGQHPLDWHARTFDRASFEKTFTDIPDLLERYKEAHAKRVQLEDQLSKFSWHKKITH
jgi:hypothetical protein